MTGPGKLPEDAPGKVPWDATRGAQGDVPGNAQGNPQGNAQGNAPRRPHATVAASSPHWPEGPRPPAGAPNVLVVLFDDVGFADFGCYGSRIATPTIDAIAARGLRLTGFHTTAMCSTTRASLLTGRNHHAVGVGCLANFDSGFPGYRGKIAADAPTLAETLRAHGYSTYMVGKWHVTPLTETGPAGPYDGWPLGRGFDRYYGFMDAETDQYAPELVRDNTPVAPPGGHADGYHLSADLVDETIRMIAGHVADRPERPWLAWLALGACHAPHQAPRELIDACEPAFADGWDLERARRLERQLATGIVPPGTLLPPRNDGVEAWDTLPAPARRLYARLQAAYAAMLEHADRQLSRLEAFLDEAGLREDTLVLVLSDNGASQEGGPHGMVNAMGPYNLQPEAMQTKLARLDDIGGPDTHSNFPWGWAMAANTPLRRYKQNTHGGGIRDPLVVSWPRGLAARGELRHGFAHAADVMPTVLELIGVAPLAVLNGRPAPPPDGESFAAMLRDGAAARRRGPQHFEMFGHRGLWQDGWKAVAYHAPGTPFEADRWELYHLDADFAETRDLAAEHPERLRALVELWWREAERHLVLPLDDRFGPRFAENALRHQGERTRFVFHAGMGHLPTDVAPDVRSRDYRIEALVGVDRPDARGVLVAHGDATSGYALYLEDGHLVHDVNVGGVHHVLRSDRPAAPGRRRLAVSVRLGPRVTTQVPRLGAVTLPSHRTATLWIDDAPAGELAMRAGFNTMVSWSGLDVGLDRGSPVGRYAAPFVLDGARLARVIVELAPVQRLDGDAVAAAEIARQ
jgi:arylsulfatase